MASDDAMSHGEYEFSAEQNHLIGNLARKMALVGFALMLFGGLQMVNGIMMLITTRSPDKVIAAAKEAGVPADKIDQLEKAFTSGGWLSPVTASSVAIAVTGLLMLLVGMWTQQSAAGFAGIVKTSGQDIRRLMDALRALHKKYNLMYTLLWIAAIVSLISLAFSLYRHFTGKG
jgi:hypothetical protein